MVLKRNQFSKKNSWKSRPGEREKIWTIAFFRVEESRHKCSWHSHTHVDTRSCHASWTRQPRTWLLQGEGGLWESVRSWIMHRQGKFSGLPDSIGNWTHTAHETSCWLEVSTGGKGHPPQRGRQGVFHPAHYIPTISALGKRDFVLIFEDFQLKCLSFHRR